MAATMHTPVPDIPGVVVEGAMKHGLMQHLNQLLGLDPNFSRFVQCCCVILEEIGPYLSGLCRFPGSQPVSFVSRSLKLLESRKYVSVNFK
jgi:hypothetical protein